MDEVVEFESSTGGLVVCDPNMFDLQGWEFGSRLGIVMDPEGVSHEGAHEPWPQQWLRAAEPLHAPARQARGPLNNPDLVLAHQKGDALGQSLDDGVLTGQ